MQGPDPCWIERRKRSSLLLAAWIVLTAPAVADDLEAVVHGNRQFSIDLYDQLAAVAEPEENLLFSPYSISTALAMTYAGARGQTADEMAHTLHFTLPDDRLHSAMGQLIGDLNGRDGPYRLHVANRLWGDATADFLPPFLETTGDHYGAALERLDFLNAPETSRQTINRWVEDKTENKIRDLLPKGSVGRGTRLVLTNAVYLDADWQRPFEKSATHNALFHTGSGELVDVSMMSQTGGFNYADADGVQLLEMIYESGDLSMVLMLPSEELGLEGLSSWLDAAPLDERLDELEMTRVNAQIPKFRATFEASLSDALSELGMPTPFLGGADFSGMSNESLRIADVRHKAFIDVDEQGTEAAAATAVIMELSTVVFYPDPTLFRADRPFAFMLRDNLTDSILFMGHIARPEAPPGAPIPEPATWVLMLLPVLAVFSARLARQVDCC